MEKGIDVKVNITSGAVEKLFDGLKPFLQKLLGPATEQVGLMFGEYFAAFRFRQNPFPNHELFLLPWRIASLFTFFRLRFRLKRSRSGKNRSMIPAREDKLKITSFKLITTICENDFSFPVNAIDIKLSWQKAQTFILL